MRLPPHREGPPATRRPRGNLERGALGAATAIHTSARVSRRRTRGIGFAPLASGAAAGRTALDVVFDAGFVRVRRLRRSQVRPWARRPAACGALGRRLVDGLSDLGWMLLEPTARVCWLMFAMTRRNARGVAPRFPRQDSYNDESRLIPVRAVRILCYCLVKPSIFL